MENVKKEKSLKIASIVIFVLMVVVFVLSLTYCTIVKIQDIVDNEDFSAFGFAFAFSIIYSSIAYEALFVATLVPLIISVKNKSKYLKWNIILTLSPVILEGLFILIGFIFTTFQMFYGDVYENFTC